MREPFAALTGVLKKISQVYKHLGTENLWWRGQPESGLKLIPRVYRGYPAGAEFNLVMNFDRQAPLRYPAWPREKSHRLILMQHFGLPTKLLDWSMGVFTALYFAVSEDRQDKSASLWALEPVKLNRRMTADPATGVFHHEAQEVEDLVDMAFQRYLKRRNVGHRILAMTGPELDLRMLVQWAVFTIHATDKPIEELPDHGNFAAEIIIPAEDRHPLRHALRIAGLSRSRLFPDLQSLAEDLGRIHKNK